MSSVSLSKTTALTLRSIEAVSHYEPNQFSLKDVAKDVGMDEKEFSTFFPAKKDLIRAGWFYIDNDFFEIALAYSKKGENFEKTFNALLDHYLLYPHFIRFALTYDYVFPRRRLPEDYPEYKQMVIDKLVKPLDLKKPTLGDTEIGYQITDHWVRELVLDLELILDGIVPDTPTMRHLMVQIIEDGLFSFNKIPGTPE